MRHDVEYQNHKNRRIELIQEAEVDRLSDLHRAHTQTDGLSGNFKRIGIVVALMVVLLAGSVAHA